MLYFVKTLLQNNAPFVLKVNKENEENSGDFITITHHLEGSEKCKVEIISSDSNNEPAMLSLATLIKNQVRANQQTTESKYRQN